jgi:triphosphoribosyl-dephospho-CoA synthase
MTRMPEITAVPGDSSVRMVEIASAAQLACLLEVAAPKPGNVSPGRHFADARYEDFLASAVAIGAPIGGAATRGIGATVRLAVDATAMWTRSNTNLGIVLLLAPLARAALGHDGRGATGTLRDALRRELDATTIDDARDVYAAIRQAAPGGLGQAETQDVKDEPTIPLLEVMRLAADRDLIAREYVTAFDITFTIGVPALQNARRATLSWDDAIVETFLTLLSAQRDTHIVRRRGASIAAEVTERARIALGAGGVRSVSGRRAIDEMDRAMRDADNSANPGTTADLTAAAIFVVLLGGGWTLVDGGTDAATR